MKTKPKTNLSKIKQEELLKLRNDETTVVKHPDKGEAAVTLSAGHYQNMIMQHLLDEHTYTKLETRLLHR